MELASISDAALIPHAVASVLDVHGGSDQPMLSTLIVYLRRQESLIIVDNCEHLVEGAAHFIRDLLLGCPGLSVLVTSREVLAVSGEVTWRVPSLSLPDPDDDDTTDSVLAFESVRLFVARAVAARPGFVLNDDTSSHVTNICRQLDGCPSQLSWPRPV